MYTDIYTYIYTYMCLYTHKYTYTYINIYMNNYNIYNDDDCFYYHSWRNNVVIAFGTLSSFLT